MADEAPEPVKKKSKKKFILILLILLILLGGGGFGAYKFGLLDMILGGGSSNSTEEAAPAAEEGGAPAAATTTVPVQPFVVNLANPIGSKHIRLSLDLEMVNEQAVAQLNQEMVKVRDSIILLLSSKSYADLAPMEGKLQLKSEIVERINLILGGPKVVKVYFSDMVFQ